MRQDEWTRPGASAQWGALLSDAQTGVFQVFKNMSSHFKIAHKKSLRADPPFINIHKNSAKECARAFFLPLLKSGPVPCPKHSFKRKCASSFYRERTVFFGQGQILLLIFMSGKAEKSAKNERERKLKKKSTWQVWNGHLLNFSTLQTETFCLYYMSIFLSHFDPIMTCVTNWYSKISTGSIF